MSRMGMEGLTGKGMRGRSEATDVLYPYWSGHYTGLVKTHQTVQWRTVYFIVSGLYLNKKCNKNYIINM